LIDLPIPGNDDSMRSIQLVINRLTDAIMEGRAAAPAEPPPPVDTGQVAHGERERRRGPGRGDGQGLRGAVKQRDTEPRAPVPVSEPQTESAPPGEAAGAESTTGLAEAPAPDAG
jgi:small subunit ribosomal protein S2